jgi:polyphosphate kinase 2 (PPK2 family)
VLETVNLKLALSRAEYEKVLPGLQRRLYQLEKACWDNKIASIVVFEGWDAAGKGSSISTLTSRMEARGFKVHPIRPLRRNKKRYPWLRRFWLRTPSHGEMAIIDTSWFQRELNERVEKQTRKKECRQAYLDIVEFERMLAEDCVIIVKFWMHITEQEQKKRFQKISKDPLESWRITAKDWERYRKYDDYLAAAEEMLEKTDSEYAPWTIVEATSKWYARRKVFDTVIQALEARLGSAAPKHAAPGVDLRHDMELREAIAAAARKR